MKSLFIVIALAAATQVNAANVELGKYRAIDAETRSIVVDFELKANGTVAFHAATPQIKVSCKGRYSVNGNNFATALKCNSFLLPVVSVEINVTNVNPQSLRSRPGAEVNVIIDALGEDAVQYLLKKVN